MKKSRLVQAALASVMTLCGTAAIAQIPLFEPPALEKLLTCNDFQHVYEYDVSKSVGYSIRDGALAREALMRDGWGKAVSDPVGRFLSARDVFGLQAIGYSAGNVFMFPGPTIIFDTSFEKLKAELERRGHRFECRTEVHKKQVVLTQCRTGPYTSDDFREPGRKASLRLMIMNGWIMPDGFSSATCTFR